MNDIHLQRFCYHPEATLGVVKLEGTRFYSIECPWMNNEKNISCIPVGSYKMHWRDSPRFGWTWELQDVPDRSYILIHVANFTSDIEGCIGLGMGLMGDKIAVARSRDALREFEKLTKESEWQLVISNAPYAGL